MAKLNKEVVPEKVVLVREGILMKALMTEVTSLECVNVVRAYQRLDEYYFNNQLKAFGRALLSLNKLSFEHRYGYFITKAISSDKELLEMAEQAYDAFNAFSAECCEDSYTKQESKAQ